MELTDGYYMNDLIIWKELDKTGYASRGFELYPPDLRNGAVSTLHEFEDKLKRMLVTIMAPARTQWHWAVDSDYKDVLEAYDAKTNTTFNKETGEYDNQWSYDNRKERYHRYVKRMEEGRLRREKLRIYISIPIETKRSAKDYKEPDEKLLFYDSTLKGLSAYFDTQYNLLQHIFGQGTLIVPMTDESHYSHHAEFFNPSFTHRNNFDPIDKFDRSLSILGNSLNSGFNGNNRSDTDDYAFFSDGFYHNILNVKRWPQATYQSMIYTLTSLKFLDYSITVNIVPGDLKKEILMEEKDIERLRGDYRATNKESLLNAIEKKQKKIRNLTSGYTQPIQVEYIIRLWSTTREGLTGKTSALKAAINLMESCQVFESTLSSQAVNLYAQTVPGWIFGKYKPASLYAESDFIAALLPYSATFTGHLKEAEALYDGDNFNLVGVRNFIGSQPQHGAVFGMSGSGKSAQMCDLLSQTEPYYGYTVIIEEGLSYGVYTATMGTVPIIIHPDSELTINYFDTHGLPLNSSQISNATALVSQMCGAADSAERENLRFAMIQNYIEQMYEDAFEAWTRANKEQLHEIIRYAMACQEYKVKHMPPGTTLVDTYIEFRDLGNEDPEKQKALLDKFTASELTRFYKTPETTDIVKNFVFAWFTPEEFPTHSELQEIMITSPNSSHDKSDVKKISTLISAWNAGGSYGPLFDGHTNIKLTGKLAHFELGYISEATPELKKLAAFLITNYTRNHIMALPRKIKKRYIFEEAGRLLNMPGGEKLISEAYAQMRKFGAWIVSIVQQYTQFKNTNIRPIIMGNSKQFFIMKQADRNDLKDLADADRGGINLPEVTQETIMNYPSPENLPKTDIYSSFTYFHQDNLMPKIGTCRNYCSPEMLYCSSSSGEDFDQRMREIKSEDNVVAAIKKYS
jgi:type IV secretion system protein TrbE